MNIIKNLALALCLFVPWMLQAKDGMKELKEVPPAFRTDINLVPLQEGIGPSIKNSVSIGNIGNNFVIFHGKRLEVSAVVIFEEKDKNIIQITTKPTAEGGWSFGLIQGKEEGKPNDWCHFVVSHDSLDLSVKGPTEVYVMVFGQKVVLPKSEK